MDNIDISKFPFEKIRPEQEGILNLFDKYWDKRYIIWEGSTGIGKSAIAVTMAQNFDNAYIITSTKQLQDQYMKDFNNLSITSIKGKANYKCNLNRNLNCESGFCAIDKSQLKMCKQNCTCEYYNLLNKAKKSNMFLTSYQYFLRAVDCSGHMKPRNVLIFDECHLLEKQLVTWAEMKLSPREIIEQYGITEQLSMQDYVQISMPPTQSGLPINRQWLLSMFNLIFLRRNEKFEEIKETLGLTSGGPDSLTQDQLDSIFGTHREYYQLDKLYKKLDVFFKSSDNESWIIDPWKDGLQLIPINIATIFHNYIKGMAINKIIFMSATILDLQGFRKTLGLPKEKTLLIRTDSEFNPKKSPVIYNPICKMNFQELNKNLDKITIAVKNILDEHPNEKGIIHAGNSTISKYLQDHIKSERLLVRYGDTVNDDIIKKHYNTDKPTVLVSSSLSEGVDLKDGLSRFQIIVKCPFLSLADKRVNKKSKINKNWYTVEMLKAVIQQCGRSTRNQNDYSITYVLDSSFKWWVKHHQKKGWFIPQFLNRIIWDQNEFDIIKFKKFNI